MSFSIDTALREGFERTTARTGLLLTAILLALQFVTSIFAQSYQAATLTDAERELLDSFAATQNVTPLAVPLPAPVSGLLLILGQLATVVVTIAAIRVFVSDHIESIPTSMATRRLGRTILTWIATVFLTAIPVLIGFIFLIIPGIFIAISFAFAIHEVVVEDRGPVSALQGSWELASGNRWSLLGLFIILGVTGLFIGLLAAALTVISPIIGVVGNTVVNSVLGIFSMAVVARAYAQLRAGRSTADEGVGANTSDNFSGYER